MRVSFPYKWRMADGYPAPGVAPNNCRVFGAFICGGGSTMGYKLAGFEHLGGVELDPELAQLYRLNHKPKYLFNEDIRDFLLRDKLPDELYNLDVLDGSPPCSSFSLSGNRDRDWGKTKVFREGQARQTLDDLFFVFIALARRLQPRVVVAENVKGMLAGSAKAYIKQIQKKFFEAGYAIQLFLLNAKNMGVPQSRERLFFIGIRRDQVRANITLIFNGRPIPFGIIEQQTTCFGVKPCSDAQRKWWELTAPGQSFSKAHPKGSFFNSYRADACKVLPTVTASARASASGLYHYQQPRHLHVEEYVSAGSFPTDYDFNGIANPVYPIGMSVPPVMAAHVAYQVFEQVLRHGQNRS